MSYQFTAAQRQRLLALKLLPAQIEALQSHALRAIAGHSEPAKLEGARRTLEQLHEDATRLLKTLQAMEPIRLPNELESVRLLLLAAHFSRKGPLPSHLPMPDELLSLLTDFAIVSERALVTSREIQERKHFASPIPIDSIVRIIRDGWPANCAHPVAMTGEWLLEVAGVCYEAAGRENTDPERAVKAFMRWEAGQRQKIAEELNLSEPASKA